MHVAIIRSVNQRVMMIKSIEIDTRSKKISDLTTESEINLDLTIN